MRKIALNIEGRLHMRLGTGVTAKTTSAAIWCSVALAAVAIWMPSGPEKLPTIIILALLEALYLFGTWIHTTINPHEPLEGPNLVAYFRNVGTKDHPQHLESVAIVRDPLALPSGGIIKGAVDAP